MRKPFPWIVTAILVSVGLTLWGGRTFVEAQTSPGGAFLTNYDYVLDTPNGWRWLTRTPFVIEGATNDAFETTLTFDEPTADTTLTFPDGGGASAAFMVSSLTTNDVNAANGVWGASNALVFEGATADGNELSLAPADVAADRTMTIPDAGAAAALMFSTLTTNTVDAANSLWFETASTIVFEGATADGNEAKLTFADPAADGTLTLTIAGQANGEQLQTNGTGTLTWEAGARSARSSTSKG